jgi:hypothetical protein
MRFIPLKPQRLYCQNCEDTYSLPQNGTIKLYKEIRCPLDNFELVLFSLGKWESELLYLFRIGMDIVTGVLYVVWYD